MKTIWRLLPSLFGATCAGFGQCACGLGGVSLWTPGSAATTPPTTPLAIAVRNKYIMHFVRFGATLFSCPINEKVYEPCVKFQSMCSDLGASTCNEQYGNNILTGEPLCGCHAPKGAITGASNQKYMAFRCNKSFTVSYDTNAGKNQQYEVGTSICPIR